MVERLVKKYGKQLIEELISLMYIKGNLNGIDMRKLLLQYGAIKKTTKTIKAWCNTYQPNGIMPNGTWGKTDDIHRSLSISNGRNQTLIYISFKDSELDGIMKYLRETD